MKYYPYIAIIKLLRKSTFELLFIFLPYYCYLNIILRIDALVVPYWSILSHFLSAFECLAIKSWYFTTTSGFVSLNWLTKENGIWLWKCLFLVKVNRKFSTYGMIFFSGFSFNRMNLKYIGSKNQDTQCIVLYHDN